MQENIKGVAWLVTTINKLNNEIESKQRSAEGYKQYLLDNYGIDYDTVKEQLREKSNGTE